MEASEDSCEKRTVNRKSENKKCIKPTESKCELTKCISSTPSHPGIQNNEIILKTERKEKPFSSPRS